MFDPDKHNAEVILSRNNSYYRPDDERWSCTVELSKEGSTYRVQKYGATKEEAWESAMTQMDSMCPKDLKQPIIEHQPVPGVYHEPERSTYLAADFDNNIPV